MHIFRGKECSLLLTNEKITVNKKKYNFTLVILFKTRFKNIINER